MMRQIALAVVALGTALLFAPAAQACYCGKAEVPKALNAASAVFLGEVIDITEPRTTEETAPLPGRFFTIRFKVEKSWKGIAFGSTEIDVLSAQGRYGCFAFPPVKKGERYLVYADSTSGDKGWVIITNCTRTTIVRRDTFRYFGQEEIDPYKDMKHLDAVTNFDFGRAGKSKRRSNAGVYFQAPSLRHP